MAFICCDRGGEIMVHKAGPTCMKNCYCLIYCNTFAMSCLGAHLCSPCLSRGMSRSDGTKESYDLVWLNCCS